MDKTFKPRLKGKPGRPANPTGPGVKLSIIVPEKVYQWLATLSEKPGGAARIVIQEAYANATKSSEK